MPTCLSAFVPFFCHQHVTILDVGLQLLGREPANHVAVHLLEVVDELDVAFHRWSANGYQDSALQAEESQERQALRLLRYRPRNLLVE